MKTILISVIILVSVSITLTGQEQRKEPIKSATITYATTVKGNVDPMVQKSIDKMVMKISFHGEFMKVTQTNSYGFSTVISDSKKNESLLLSSIMGQKVAVRLSNEELDQLESRDDDFQAEYEETGRMIAGYPCFKATIISDTKLILFYTEEILPENENFKYSYRDLLGFPLEIITTEQDAEFKFTATKVETPALESFEFEVPEGFSLIDFATYKIMTNYTK